MSLWNDFNDAQTEQQCHPQGHAGQGALTIRPGGFDDPAQGWTGGYAKRGSTGAVYLDGEYTVLEGPYAKRKIWSLIGLYSPKGPDWANMGRSLVRGMLNSARGISDKDNSARRRRRAASTALPISTGSSSSPGSTSARTSTARTRTRSKARSCRTTAITRRSWARSQRRARHRRCSIRHPRRSIRHRLPLRLRRAIRRTAPQPQQTPRSRPAAPGFSGRPSWAE